MRRGFSRRIVRPRQEAGVGALSGVSCQDGVWRDELPLPSSAVHAEAPAVEGEQLLLFGALRLVHAAQPDDLAQHLDLEPRCLRLGIDIADVAGDGRLVRLQPIYAPDERAQSLPPPRRLRPRSPLCLSPSLRPGGCPVAPAGASYQTNLELPHWEILCAAGFYATIYYGCGWGWEVAMPAAITAARTTRTPEALRALARSGKDATQNARLSMAVSVLEGVGRAEAGRMAGQSHLKF